MISIVLGTRPEIIKLFPVINYFTKKKFEFNIIHTGQHYSKKLNSIFFNQLKLSSAKITKLNIGSDSHGSQIAKMVLEIEKYLKKNNKIKLVLVYGDTNSALAGCLACVKIPKIKLIHLEAGLRSFDKRMPEEVNRRIIDHCSDLLLCPTFISKKFLINEGINPKKIFRVGNTIVDAIKSRLVSTYLMNNNLPEKYDYGVLTIHREENTISEKNLKKILLDINKVAKKNNLKFLFPVHPKTKKILAKIKSVNKKFIKLLDPLDYFKFMKYLKNAKLIVSDSGGIQEEACILKVPLVTVRNSTERQETINIGCNKLSKINDNRLEIDCNYMLNKKINWNNPYGSGNSSVKIYKILKKFLKVDSEKYY